MDLVHGTAAAECGTLTDSERQPCEVWTRVMGYHRPVSSFNVGKRGEHAERRMFRESCCETRAPQTLFV